MNRQAIKNGSARRMSFLTFIMALVLILSLSLTACSSVVAKGENVNVKESALIKLMNMTAVLSSQSLDDLKKNNKDQYDSLYDDTLKQLAVVDILKAKYSEKDLPSSMKDDIKANMDYIYSTESGIADTLKKGKVEKSTVEDYLKSTYYLQKYAEDVKAEQPVTDDSIKKYFEEHKSEYVAAATINVSHILIGDNTKSEADKTKAQEILAKAKAGEDFAALAKEYSVDTGSAENGGALGEAPASTYVTEFATAAEALGDGEISGLVESEFGWHIIKGGPKTAERPKTLEEATEDIRSLLENDTYSKAIEKLLESAKIVYSNKK